MSEFHAVRLVYTQHDEEDVEYADEIRALLGDRVAADDAPAEVMVVLVGPNTWRDSEVAESIAHAMEVIAETELPRRALMGLLLPTYDYPGLSKRQPHGLENLHATTPRDGRYWACNVPRVLFDNLQAGYAQMRPFSRKTDDLATWIHEAATARGRELFTPVRPTERYAERDIGWAPYGPEGVVGGAVNVRR